MMYQQQKDNVKTNQDKNAQHTTRVDGKVRPKAPVYEFVELQAIVNSWIKGNV